MIDRTQIRNYLDEIAGAFGFLDARQAFNILTDTKFRRDTEGNYLAAIHVTYKETPETNIVHMAMFIHDLLIDPAGGLTFYSLAPASGDLYKDHFDQLIEAGSKIETAEQLLDVIKDPSLLGVPVQREFHNILTYSSSLAGVVNYTRDSATDDIKICAPFSFMPVIDKSLFKKEKPEKGEGTVTHLPTRPKK